MAKLVAGAVEIHLARFTVWIGLPIEIAFPHLIAWLESGVPEL